MSITTNPEAPDAQKSGSQTEDIMSDMASEHGRDGKEQARKLAGGGSDGALDRDVTSKGINLAQKAASDKAGGMAESIGGQAGKTVAQDTTKIAAEAAKGATKGAAAGGAGAVPGAITGAAKGAAQTKTGRITVAVILIPVIAYFAFIALLPLLLMTVLTSGGEQGEQNDNVSEVGEFLEEQFGGGDGD